MIDVRNTWWFVTIAVLLVSALIVAFIPGYRPGSFVLLSLALLAFVFMARRPAKDDA